MSAPLLQRTVAEQHAFNGQVWDRLVDDPALDDVLERVETDRDGNVIMSPPPSLPQRVRQDRINQLLKRHLREGESFVEGAVSTPEGVKVADLVWYRAESARALEGADVSLAEFAPDICVEVRSKGNRPREVEQKIAAHFGAGVREVWVCNLDGAMTFGGRGGSLERSVICPDFPREIPAAFLH